MKSNYRVPLIITLILAVTSFMPALHLLIYQADLYLLPARNTDDYAVYNWIINFPLILVLIVIFIKSENSFISNVAAAFSTFILMSFLLIVGKNFIAQDPIFGLLVASIIAGGIISLIGYSKYRSDISKSL